MTRELSLDNLFYGRHETKTFSGGISKLNVFKRIKLVQFFCAEFCCTKNTLKAYCFLIQTSLSGINPGRIKKSKLVKSEPRL